MRQRCMVLWAAGIFLVTFPVCASAQTADEHYGRGLTLYSAGDYEAAAAALQQALQRNPGHTQAEELLRIIEELESDSAQTQDVLTQLTEVLKVQGQESRRLKDILSSAEERVTELAAEQQVAQRTIVELQGQLATVAAQAQEQAGRLTQQLAAAHETVAGLEQRTDALGRKGKKLQQDLTVREAELTQLTEERARLQDERTGLQGQLATVAAQAQEQAAHLTQQLAAAHETVAGLEQRTDALGREGKKLQQDLTVREAELTQVTKERAQAQDNLIRLQAQLDTTQQTQQDLETARGNLSGVNARLTTQLADLQNRYTQREQELSNRRVAIADLEVKRTVASERQTILEANLKEHMRDNTSLVGQLGDSEAELERARGRLESLERAQESSTARTVELEQALETSNRALERTSEDLVGVRADHANLQAQLKIAQETRTQLTGHLQGLESVQAQRDELKLAVSEKETRVSQLEAGVTRLNRELTTTTLALEQRRTELEAQNRQATMDRQGLEAHLGTLQRELTEASDAQAHLREQLAAERSTQEETEQTYQATKDRLAERQIELKQAEALIEALQGSWREDTRGTPALATTVAAVEASGATASVGSGADAPKEPERFDQGHRVLVYHMNEEFDFLVISVDGIEGAKEGMTLILANATEPVARVQLTELDDLGFAVAEITHRVDAAMKIQQGDTLFARELLKPGGD